MARDGGARPLLRLLREGRVVLLVADRVVGGGDALAVPFGTGHRLLPTGPASLALASGAPVLVGSIVRSPGGPARYTVRLEPALHPVRTGDAARDRATFTHQLAARLAALAGEHPEQWFVFQPEWLPRERPDDR